MSSSNSSSTSSRRSPCRIRQRPAARRNKRRLPRVQSSGVAARLAMFEARPPRFRHSRRNAIRSRVGSVGESAAASASRPDHLPHRMKRRRRRRRAHAEPTHGRFAARVPNRRRGVSSALPEGPQNDDTVLHAASAPGAKGVGHVRRERVALWRFEVSWTILPFPARLRCRAVGPRTEPFCS